MKWLVALSVLSTLPRPSPSRDSSPLDFWLDRPAVSLSWPGQAPPPPPSPPRRRSNGHWFCWIQVQIINHCFFWFLYRYYYYYYYCCCEYDYWLFAIVFDEMSVDWGRSRRVSSVSVCCCGRGQGAGACADASAIRRNIVASSIENVSDSEGKWDERMASSQWI